MLGLMTHDSGLRTQDSGLRTQDSLASGFGNLQVRHHVGDGTEQKNLPCN